MLGRYLLATAIAILVALPVRAQTMPGMTEPADHLMADALASPQGEALLRTFVANVRKSGDPACLRAKALDDAALTARGRALLLRRGVQAIGILDEKLDRAAFQAALAESGEPGAVDEMRRLRDEPDVKVFLELYRPVQLAQVLDRALEQFDRHVLIARIRLDPVSPIARGEPDPIKDSLMEAAEAAAQKHLEDNPSSQTERFLDLSDVVVAATSKGFSPKAAANIGPMQLFAGVEGDLAELCVGKHQR